jgi:hypothetical protein
MKKNITPPEICGEVVAVNKQPSEKTWYKVKILANVQVFNDVEEQVFELKAFGKVAEKVASLRAGDYIVCRTMLQSKEWKEKYYPEISLVSFTVQSNAVPPEDVAKQAAEQAFAGTENGTTEIGSDASLTF